MSQIQYEDLRPEGWSSEVKAAIIAEAIARDAYSGSIPDDDALRTKVAKELVELALDFWYADETPPRGEERENVLAVLGVAGVACVNDELVVQGASDPVNGAVVPNDQAGATDPDPGVPILEEPWDGYDKQRVSDILAFVNGFETPLSDDERDYIIKYERANKNRITLISHFEIPPQENEESERLDSELDQAIERDDADEPTGSQEEEQGEGRLHSDESTEEQAESVEQAEERQLSGDGQPAPQVDTSRLAGVSEASHQARERFIAKVREQRLPEPPQPQFDTDPVMPNDVSQLSDDDLYQLYIDFNACLTRANWLLGLALADESFCERQAKRARSDAAIRLRNVKPIPLMEAQIELDEQVQEWEDAHDEAEQEVKGYTKLASSYQGNVDRLSRLAGLRRGEEERARA